MKKLFIFFLLFVAGCTYTNEVVSWEKSQIYKIENIGQDKDYYFEYPEGAFLNEGSIDYHGCVVNFGTESGIDVQTDDVNTLDGESEIWSSYLGEDGKMLAYSIQKKSPQYYFWSQNEEEGVGDCVNFIEQIANSFTDKIIYRNNRYAYRSEILPRFDVEYLADGSGIVMRRSEPFQVEEKDGRVVDATYTVEIGLEAKENEDGYQSVSEYVGMEYPGFTADFVSNGAFVDEDSMGNAIRHYFMISSDKKYIYEAYLKIPQQHYGKHQGGFDDFTSSIEVY